MSYNLERFLREQETDYEVALKEVKRGLKLSCWMWYVFPQLKELGQSSTAKYFGIDGIEEAKAYLENDILSERLIEISNELLKLEDKNADRIFGYPDNLKLKSCMTLFSMVSDNPIFQKVIDEYFDGNKCERTIEILRNK